METNTLSQALAIAQNGSPQLLHAAGRVFGLGAAERAALAEGAIPRWAVGLLAMSAGVAAGIAIHRQWPKQADKLLGK